MGRKTVKWDKIPAVEKGLPCEKCLSHGIIQGYDWANNHPYYYYCDCYFGELAKEKNSWGKTRWTQILIS